MIGGSSRLPFSILISLRSQISDRFIVSGLTVLAVATSVSLAMSVEVASRALQEGLRTTTQALVGSAALTISAGDVGVPEEVLARVGEVPGVLSASPLIRRTMRVASGEHQGRALHVVGLDFLSDSDVRRYEVSRAGTVVRDAVRLLALPNSVVLSEAFATELGIGDGDRLELTLEGRPLELVVRGVLGGEMAEAFGGQIAAMDIFALQQVADVLGRFERIDVAVEPDQSIDEVAARIEVVIGPALALGRDAERETFGLALLRTYQRALWAFVIVALATSTLLTYAVSSMSIDRRLDELTLLRTAGMDGAQVGRLVLTDSLVIAVVGTALGAAAAPVVLRAVFGILSIASAVLREIELGEPRLALPTIALGLFVGIVTVVAAALPAARRAARIGPFELLDLGRGTIHFDRTRRRAALFSLVGAALLGLAWVDYAAPSALRIVAGIAGGIALAGGLGHQLIGRYADPAGWMGRWVPRIGFLIGPTLRARPVETALTIAAWTTIAAGLVTGVTTIRSYTGSIDGYYYGLYGESAVILLAGDPFGSDGLEAISPATMELLRASGRVEELAEIRGIEVPFRGRVIVVTSLATNAISRRGDLAFIGHDPEGTRAALKRRELVMNESFGQRFGIRVGDSIVLPSKGGPLTFRIGASATGTAGSSGSLLLDESAFDDAFASSAATLWMAALWVVSPENESVEALRRMESAQPLFLLRGKEARRWVARSAEKYRAMLSVPVALVCGLALVSLQALLFGTTRSRRREFALLRAAGATRANVVAIITLGGSLIGVLGSIFGIAIGAIWSAVTCSFLSESIGWKIIPIQSTELAGWVVVGAAVIAVLGSLIPALLATRVREVTGSQTP